MNTDLYDDVKEAISEEWRIGDDADMDYAAAQAMMAFGKFLRSRRFYSVDEMLQEMRDMLLTPLGDFRDEFDEIIKS